MVLGDRYVIKTLSEIGCTEDIAETADTLEGNALIKARYVKEKYGYDCFAEDSGLEIEALNGDPGVYTARYAGPQRNHDDNMDLVLKNLAGKDNRKARFRAVMALIQGEEEQLIEGVCNGIIAQEKSGNGGFGYDPIFIPVGYKESFASLGDDVKKEISHRARAIRKLIEQLAGD